MPDRATHGLVALASMTLGAYAIQPRWLRGRRVVTRSVTFGLLAFAVSNTIRFFVLVARGKIAADCPIPFSLFVGAALGLGVAASDIAIDAKGVNTEATSRNTAAMFDSLGVRRVLVVSHFYRLPRIKLSYQRQGREVYTVPARQTRMPARLPRYMAREVAALWVYYGRPLWPAE